MAVSYIDRMPLPSTPAGSPVHLAEWQPLPWRDPLGRPEPRDVAPAPRAGADAPAGEPPAPGAASSPAPAAAARPAGADTSPAEEPADARGRDTDGLDMAELLCDVSDTLFENKPIKPKERRMVGKVFKAKVTEEHGAGVVLAVIFLPRIWQSEPMRQVRAWLWANTWQAFTSWWDELWATPPPPDPAAAARNVTPEPERTAERPEPAPAPAPGAPQRRPSPAAAATVDVEAETSEIPPELVADLLQAR